MKTLIYLMSVFYLITCLNLKDSQASAVLDLKGQYDLEGVWIRNARLEGSSEKFYVLHGLRLKPEMKIIDALSIYGRFDVLTNPWSDIFGYKGGRFWGATSSSGFQQPWLDITHLYFSWSNEFVKVMGGRMPLDFGLGLLFDSGEDSFDHFADHLDGVGVQIQTGHLEIYPGYGLRRGGIGSGGDIHEYFLQLKYEMVDLGLLMGLMYSGRIGRQGQEWTYGPLLPYSLHSPTRDMFHLDRSMATSELLAGGYNEVEQWRTNTLATYLERDFSFGTLSLEMDFILDSRVGIRANAASNEALELSGHAIVAEWTSHPGVWHYGLKMGYLSGDDPETEDKYEGFLAHRNYDVGMLLFNHAISNRNITGGSHYDFSAGPQATFMDRPLWPDFDYLTNAFFIAPHLKRSLFKNAYLTSNLVWARLMVPSQLNTRKTNLGVELDVGFLYEVNQHLSFGIETGWLVPGPAFVGDKKLIYGVQAKAGVSF